MKNSICYVNMYKLNNKSKCGTPQYERTINMNAWGIVLGILLAIVSIAIIVVIILQEGNQQGIGVVTGAADSYFSKNKARSIDAFLSRWTKVFAAVFVLFVIALNVLSYFNLLG